MTNKKFLLLSKQEWQMALVFAALVTLATYPAYSKVTLWLAAPLFCAVVTIIHMSRTASVAVPFPQLALLVGFLQYVFSPWLSNTFPPHNIAYDIGDDLAVYLSYACPMYVALTLAWLGIFSGLPERTASAPPKRASESYDLLLAVGILGLLLSYVIRTPQLAFPLVLLGNLRYVGLYGRMLAKESGWAWRLALVLGIETVLAAETAMFHHLVLWSAWTFAIWCYSFAPRPSRIIAVTLLGAVLIPSLEQAKWSYRESALSSPGFDTGLASRVMKAASWAKFMGIGLGKTITFSLDPAAVSDMLVRYNQGWIVNRVMQHVPTFQPYARGRTLADAAVGSLVPRVFAPNKAISGGRAEMQMYAGINLNEATSMNLGYAGEMYANFGRWGGVLGCAAYALAFGALFRLFGQQAARSILWWSFLPFVCFPALKAEDGIGPILNWTTKGALVTSLIILVAPQIRRALLVKKAPQPASQQAEAQTQHTDDTPPSSHSARKSHPNPSPATQSIPRPARTP